MPDVINTLLPVALGFIMFAVGVTLVPADFMRLFEQPRAVLAGLSRPAHRVARRGLAARARLAPVARDGRRSRDPRGLSRRRELGADHASRPRFLSTLGHA